MSRRAGPSRVGYAPGAVCAEYDEYLGHVIGHDQMLELARAVLGEDLRFDHMVSLIKQGGLLRRRVPGRASRDRSTSPPTVRAATPVTECRAVDRARRPADRQATRGRAGTPTSTRRAAWCVTCRRPTATPTRERVFLTRRGRGVGGRPCGRRPSRHRTAQTSASFGSSSTSTDSGRETAGRLCGDALSSRCRCCDRRGNHVPPSHGRLVGFWPEISFVRGPFSFRPLLLMQKAQTQALFGAKLQTSHPTTARCAARQRQGCFGAVCLIRFTCETWGKSCAWRGSDSA